jgi:hypothetical protein
MTQPLVLTTSTSPNPDDMLRPTMVHKSGLGDSATLTALPFHNRRPLDQGAWLATRQRLGTFASLPIGWNGGRALPPNQHTVRFVAEELAAIQRSGLPAPAVNPSADGAVFAHWHSSGIDVEVIFEKPYQVTSLIEDARGELEEYEGEDANLSHTTAALLVMASR